MRRIAWVIPGLLLVGCASKPQPTQDVASGPTTLPSFEPVQASALVFDPRLPSYGPASNLSREPRERSAFVGYDDLVTTYFYVRVDDRQRYDLSDRHGHFGLDGDRYERRTIIQAAGVRTR